MNDMFNGKGVYSFSNGQKYIGNFVDGNFDGEGKFIYSDGYVKQGIFHNGYMEEKNNGKKGLLYLFIFIFLISLSINILLLFKNRKWILY